jgi:hypothetical protein
MATLKFAVFCCSATLMWGPWMQPPRGGPWGEPALAGPANASKGNFYYIQMLPQPHLGLSWRPLRGVSLETQPYIGRCSSGASNMGDRSTLLRDIEWNSALLCISKAKRGPMGNHMGRSAEFCSSKGCTSLLFYFCNRVAQPMKGILSRVFLRL